MIDVEMVERWVAYCRRPKLRPLRGYYRLWGHEMSKYLPEAEGHKGAPERQGCPRIDSHARA